MRIRARGHGEGWNPGRMSCAHVSGRVDSITTKEFLQEAEIKTSSSHPQKDFFFLSQSRLQKCYYIEQRIHIFTSFKICAHCAGSSASRVIPRERYVSLMARTREVTDVVWVKIYSASPNWG
jgi:hypothetical protein